MPTDIAGRDVVLVLDHFPELSETFVVAEARALAELGWGVRIEALRRPANPDPGAADGLQVRYAEDDSRAERLGGLGWLLARHPVRCARDVFGRRSWRTPTEPAAPLRSLAPLARRLARGGEAHLHAHFAVQAAQVAARLAALCGVPWSFTAHGYDIFQRPANLERKLALADFATSGSDYTVAHLRSLAPAHADRIHRIVMGVDQRSFTRETPYAGGRSLLAIGRLVEKKGFGGLLEAVALLRDESPVDSLTIVGEGPLRTALERRIQELGLEGVATIAGALRPKQVRAHLERADALVAPCVIAADGDRDSMPVVVKEALAMEVPVVASDAVGLPEVVRPGWGRVAKAGDAMSLARAIRELLSLSPPARVEMGKAGREFVLSQFDVGAQTAELAALIEAAQEPARAGRPLRR